LKQHLLPEQLEQLKSGKALPEELRAAGDHLAFCSECRKKVLEEKTLQEMILSIRDEVESEDKDSDHLKYEQTEAYIDETLDEVDQEIVESHLEVCSRCEADATELKSFKNSLQFEHAQRKPLVRKRFSIPLQLAALAVVMVIAVWISTQSLRNRISDLDNRVTQLQNENQKLRNDYQTAQERLRLAQRQSSNAAIVTTLIDGTNQITLDSEGRLNGFASLSDSLTNTVKSVLLNAKLDLPPVLVRLTLTPGEQRSLPQQKTGIVPLSPVATVVREQRPQFRWTPFAEQTVYNVTIYDMDFHEVMKSGELQTTTWTPGTSLERGRIYIWNVSAVKEGETIASSAPGAKFQVLEQDKAEELERAEQQSGGSHLLLGILYAQNGLLTESKKEFAALAKANPNSPVVNKLIQGLPKS
jgi:hypothetical protein